MHNLYTVTDIKINKTYTVALSGEEFHQISEAMFNINKREGYRFEIERVATNTALQP